MCQAATGREVKTDVEPVSGFLRGLVQPPSHNGLGKTLVFQLCKNGGCDVEGTRVEPSLPRAQGVGVSKHHAGTDNATASPPRGPPELSGKEGLA